MNPLIGLTTYREQALWGVWDTKADLLPETYARAVEAVGGVPVLLPPTNHPSPEEAARTVVDRIDGLVVSGGADVSPHRYAADPHPRTVSWRDDRDTWENVLPAANLQRLGFARMLIHRPRWIFLQNATESLSPADELAMTQLLHGTFPQATIITIGHSSIVGSLYRRHLVLERMNQRAHLREVARGPATTPAPP